MTVLYVTKECFKCQGFGTETNSNPCFYCNGKGTILVDHTVSEDSAPNQF